MITTIATRDADGAYVLADVRVAPCAREGVARDTLWRGPTASFVVDSGATHTSVRRDLLPPDFRTGTPIRTRFADGRVADSPTATVHLAISTPAGPRAVSVRAIVTTNGFNLIGLDLLKGLHLGDGRSARVSIGHIDVVVAPVRSDTPTLDRVIAAIGHLTEVLSEHELRPPGCTCIASLEGARQ